MNAPTPPAAPAVALILKIDTLGDLVLFAPTLRCLREAGPQTRLVVVIRRAYLDLAPLLAPGVEWLATVMDPFAHGPDADPAELARLRAAIAALQPDVVAAASSRRHWLDVALAAAAPTVSPASGARTRRLSLGAVTDDAFFATQLHIRLGLRAAEVFTETISLPADEPDWSRNLVLADALIGRTAPRDAPSLKLEASIRMAAEKILTDRQLAPGRFAVCAAAGFANVKIKTWPAERFGAALAHLRAQHNLPTLLVGQESERAHLELVQRAAGDAAPQLWLGRDGELPVLAALIAGSAIYFGNDTGAMHLAAALDVPVVAVFGGGTWPRFTPAARRGVALVQPLPCFGCSWDCAFEDAPCLGGITVADATAALDTALTKAGQETFTVTSLAHVTADVRDLMGRAATRYRAMGVDHAIRQRKLEEKDVAILEKEASIFEKEASIAEKEASIGEKEASIGEKEASIFEKEASIAEKEAAIAEKEREIDALKLECNARERELAEKDAAILEKETSINEKEASIFEKEASIAEKEAAIAEKEAAIAEKEAEISALKTVCDERERVIFILDGQAKALRAQLEARPAAPPADPRLGELSAALAARESEIAALRTTMAERDAALQRHADGLTQLDQAQYLIRQLHEKERMLQLLSRVCADRETLILRLAAESTEPTAHLRRIGIAAAGWWRAKIATPGRTWLEQKILDGYWMQIGILKQYEPRPLKWDARLPRQQLPAHRLPRIGLVTPSFNQAQFLGSTMTSVLRQDYPHLLYVVQDGGSTDGSVEVIKRESTRLHHWASARDSGQADAIRKGFSHVVSSLAPTDLMAWLNSDDLLAPRAFHAVARYFVEHPDVDAVYGHRIIIDDSDRDIARWIMPPHDNTALEWIDYVPQETLFWRKRAWDRVGGLDPTFQFALDWDLIARFQQAGLRLVRLPWFLGAFRVHTAQKTSQQIHTLGHDEMTRIRASLHGGAVNIDPQKIEYYARKTRVEGALCARLAGLGIRV